MRIFHPCFVILLLSLGLSTTASAQVDTQTLLGIGDRRIKTSRIHSGVETFILYRISKGTRHPVSLLTRTIKLETRNNGEFIVVEQRYDSSSGVSSDTSVLLRSTLGPISYLSHLGSQTESFEFGATEMKGAITASDGTTRQLEVPLKYPVLNAVVLDEIIQSVSLSRNRSYRFRGYNPGKQLFDIKVRVVDSQTVGTAIGDLVVWVVSIDGMAVPTTVWITKDKQKLIKQKAELPNGDEFWKVRLFTP